jgi:hypothetical protein
MVMIHTPEFSNCKPKRFGWASRRRKAGADYTEQPLQIVEPEPEAVREANRLIYQQAKTISKIHGPGGAADLLAVNHNSRRSEMRKLGIPFGKDRRDN